MTGTETASSLPILLFSHDRRLAQTRHWLLEQARFRMLTVYTVQELDEAILQYDIVLFLLCNSLPAELRIATVERLRELWPDAKILVFLPSYPLPDLPVDECFPAMEGPGKLIQTIRRLIPNGSAAVH